MNRDCPFLAVLRGGLQEQIGIDDRVGDQSPQVDPFEPQSHNCCTSPSISSISKPGARFPFTPLAAPFLTLWPKKGDNHVERPVESESRVSRCRFLPVESS
ncbi:hypothetical protein HRR84_007065 [Exophiala dermatitidis]|nr:hypothetical protein HRR84_007065 [Exophiala dermatitidis]